MSQAAMVWSHPNQGPLSELLFLLPKDESLAWLALICEQPLIPQGKFQSLPPAEERKRGREKDNS